MSRPFELSKTQLLQEKRREFELVLRAPLRKTKQRTREKTFRAINFMARQTPCCCSTARIYPIIFIFVCIVKQTKTEKIESLPPYNKHRRFRTYCGSYFGERSFFFSSDRIKLPERRGDGENGTKQKLDETTTTRNRVHRVKDFENVFPLEKFPAADIAPALSTM